MSATAIHTAASIIASAETWLAAILALGAIAYLVYALLKPERF